MNSTYLVFGLLVVAAVYAVAEYNSFITLRTQIKEAFSGIDVQLKRRADLIPNLVETVKGYAKHEKGVYEEVTKARTAMMSATSVKEKADANTMMTGALKSLFAVAENYPNLKASDNFIDLQRQLEDTEDKVAYSRQFYNSNVLSYNKKVQMFPSNVIASVFHFTIEEFFGATDQERASVKVSF